MHGGWRIEIALPCVVHTHSPQALDKLSGVWPVAIWAHTVHLITSQVRRLGEVAFLGEAFPILYHT